MRANTDRRGPDCQSFPVLSALVYPPPLCVPVLVPPLPRPIPLSGCLSALLRYFRFRSPSFCTHSLSLLSFSRVRGTPARVGVPHKTCAPAACPPPPFSPLLFPIPRATSLPPPRAPASTFPMPAPNARSPVTPSISPIADFAAPATSSSSSLAPASAVTSTVDKELCRIHSSDAERPPSPVREESSSSSSACSRVFPPCSVS